jgi:hypothetical protein
MNCMEWEERVALYAGGDPAEGVEQHLTECAECREFCEGLRDTLHTLRDEHLEEIAPVHFTAVRNAVLAEIERGRRAWRRLAWVSGVGIAAALVLGIALRPAPLPGPPPRIAARIPAAELVKSIEMPTPRPVIAQRQHHPHDPFVVKLQTADPKIVIYWIAD